MPSVSSKYQASDVLEDEPGNTASENPSGVPAALEELSDVTEEPSEEIAAELNGRTDAEPSNEFTAELDCGPVAELAGSIDEESASVFTAELDGEFVSELDCESITFGELEESSPQDISTAPQNRKAKLFLITQILIT